MSRTWLALFVLGFGLNACGDDPPPCADTPTAEEGEPTGATCDGSPLTYENFGREFMETYCTRCHSSSLSGEEARSCAPDDHNFGTLDEVMINRDHIDEISAAGPDSINEGMPPSGPRPTAAERLNLGVWLACETERMP
jgi:hypothetical protein